MNKSKKQAVYLGIVVLTLLVLLIVGIATFVSKKAGKESDVQVDNLSSFGSYEYTEHHSDGSEMVTVISRVQDEYTMLQKYFGQTGDASFRINVLSKENADRFVQSVDSFTMASESVEDEKVYTKAVLTYAAASGNTMYTIEPIDISGFSDWDPWSENPKTIVSKPDYAGLFDEKELKSALNSSSDTELYAYMELIYQQVTEILDTAELDSISIAGAMVENMYPVSVQKTGEKDEIQLSMSVYGYVKNMK